jgi:serine/threonine protein kinase
MKPGAKSVAKSSPKAEPKPEVKSDFKKHSASPEQAPKMESPWEGLLGKQPENLAGYLREDPIQLEEIIDAFTSSVDALIAVRAAHTKNMALVPQNICFDRLGKAKIQLSQTSVTQGSSSAVGKPRYAVPEIFAEKASVDESMITAGHVYALGVMFYEIFLGKKLFEKTFSAQRTDLDWLRWHADLGAKAPAIKSLLPGSPVAISDLLESMMEKHAEKRIVDLDAIRLRLRDIALRANNTIVLRKPMPSVQAPVQQPATRQKKSDKTWVWILLVFVIVGMGAFLVWQNLDFLRGLISH